MYWNYKKEAIRVDKKTVRDVAVQGRRVLVRVDFNVPLKDGQVSDDTRIQASLPTLKFLITHGAKLLLCSHLGRPKGLVNPTYSLGPVAERLSQLLKCRIRMAPDCVGNLVSTLIEKIQPGEVVLLENLRFHPEEEMNDQVFARELASLAQIYVNDAFGVAHRAHASTVGVAAFLPSVAGLLMERELNFLGRVLTNPTRPFVAILGGAKVSDKITVIERLLTKVDILLVGGGMANTFLKALGTEIGRSLVEENKIDVARTLLMRAKEKLKLPVDVVVANSPDASAQSQIVGVGEIPQMCRILDIGPRTVDYFNGWLQTARTVVWNGPMGVYELAPFATGTFAVAKTLSELTGVTTVVGGGDSAAAVEHAGVSDRITHVSTGGGAALELLEGKVLPGVSVLQER